MWSDYIHWLHALPLWGQVSINAFWWSFAALLPLSIWEQRSGFHERSFDLKWWQAAPLVVAMVYGQDHYHWVRTVMGWPGRYIPHLHDLWYCIVPAVLIAALLAKQIAIAVTRSRASRPSPVAYGEPDFVTVVRRRTFTRYEED
jgi:hypothetical protein